MLKTLIFAAVFCMNAHAYCYYVPCAPTVLLEKMQLSMQIQTEVAEIQQRNSALESKYKEYEKLVEEGNRLKQNELESKIKLGVLLKQLYYEVDKFSQLQ